MFGGSQQEGKLNKLGISKLSKQVEYQGFWFLPNNPERQYPGTLIFKSNKGGLLNLIGKYEGAGTGEIVRLKETDIILGYSRGQLVTLYKCFRSNHGSTQQGIFTVTFQVLYAFLNAHFQTEDSIRFNKVYLHLAHLGEWLNLPHFESKSADKERTISYPVSQIIEKATYGNFTIQIGTVSYSHHTFFREKVTIKRDAHIIVEWDDEVSLEELWKVSRYLENFLSLALRIPVYSLSKEGESKEGMVVNGEDKLSVPVQFLHKVPKSAVRRRPIVPEQMLFTYDDVKGRLGDFLKNWFDKEALLEPVYDLYFGGLYGGKMYLHHTFLSLAQAIESYHRRTRSKQELPKVEHQKRIKNILSSVSDEYKEWLARKLDFSNEVSLKMRLRELLDEDANLLRKLIPDSEAFIKDVVNTRNYLTHYTEALKKKAASDQSLLKLIKQLEILIEIYLLKELGFKPSEIEVNQSFTGRYFAKVKNAI